MTDLGVLEQGRARRNLREAARRRARRRRRARNLLGVLVLGAVALLAFMASRLSEQHAVALTHPPVVAHVAHRAAGYELKGAPAIPIGKLKLGLKSGLLFDVRTGRVLWERRPTAQVPIASLTKMMTALIVAERARPAARVLITRDALHYSGSGVGLLPKGKRVPLESLLYGLLLPSGNDAAIALADHVAGTQRNFIAMMNAKAREMGLICTHFTTVSGIIDQGNHSCADDLAVLAHAVLTNRRLAPIVASRSAVLPFPIKGGKLYLYNNNPLLLLRYPGTDGVKTGYTVAAGECLVAAAKRGRKWFGVVLLHSGDPQDQAEKLLNAAFARG
jgi:serine-type D-Ala-D-Ala carboxypeptidase (penicillin-binding protein 5/6)